MKAAIYLPIAAALLLSSAVVQAAEEKSPEKGGHKESAKEPVATPTAVAAPAAEATQASGLDASAQVAATFFGLLQKNKVDDAYSALTKGSKIADRPDELKSLKSKTSEAIEMFGAVQGYDLVETKSVGSHMLRRTYLSLGRDFPLRWRFYFYRTENVWRLIDLRVDDRLTAIFEESDDLRSEAPIPTK